jgi:hypothetical protein
MVANGSAAVANQNGRVKSIALLECAATHAQRIGAPTGDWASPPFSVREKLDGGGIIWRHHSRCLYEEPD